MPAIHEIAYPRLKEGVTPAELAEVYTPTAEELALAVRTSTRSGPCVTNGATVALSSRR